MDQKGACIVLGKNIDLPVFGENLHCYIIHHQVLLHVNQLHTEGFIDHIHSFIIHHDKKSQVLVWTSDLLDYHVYGLYCRPMLTKLNSLFLSLISFTCKIMNIIMVL